MGDFQAKYSTHFQPKYIPLMTSLHEYYSGNFDDDDRKDFEDLGLEMEDLNRLSIMNSKFCRRLGGCCFDTFPKFCAARQNRCNRRFVGTFCRRTCNMCG